MEENQQDHLSDMDLQIDSEVRQCLNDSSRWTRFISIIVFIFCALLLLASIVGSSAIMAAIDRLANTRMNFISGFTWGIIFIAIIMIVVIMAFVYYFLFNFSLKTRAALLNEDVETLNKGLNSLKTFFIITTILSVVTLLLNIVGLLK